MLKNAETIMSYIKDEAGLAEMAQVGVDLTIDKLYEIQPDFSLTRSDKKMADTKGVLPVNLVTSFAIFAILHPLS